MNPSFYPHMPAAEYHAMKALAASGVDALVNECPWKFWQASPWNPAYAPKHHEAFDLGIAAHLAVLEPAQFDERVTLIDAENYTTKAAREARDAAYAAGKTPLTPSQHKQVAGMARAIFEQAGSYFTGGHAESTLVWEWDGVLCKARPDYLLSDRPIIIDLKTTTTANPYVIARKAKAEGWASRAIWYTESVSRVRDLWADGPMIKLPVRYIFIVVETAPPHLIQTFEMGPRSLYRGQQAVRRGLSLFRACMERNEWPAYHEGVLTIEEPGWADHEWADREAAGEFSDKIAAAREWSHEHV